MKSLLVFVALLLSVAVSETGQPFELKGETPGTTTLKQFKTNHKHSECFSETSHMTLCRVYDGVSFAGVTSESYKGCASIDCSAQGIVADFVDDRMVSLTYGVIPNSSSQIIEVLKTKFGEPTETTKTSTIWRNSVGYLNVSEIYVPASNGSAQDVATSVTSALNDTGQTKDI